MPSKLDAIALCLALSKLAGQEIKSAKVARLAMLMKMAVLGVPDPAPPKPSLSAAFSQNRKPLDTSLFQPQAGKTNTIEGFYNGVAGAVNPRVNTFMGRFNAARARVESDAKRDFLMPWTSGKRRDKISELGKFRDNVPTIQRGVEAFGRMFTSYPFSKQSKFATPTAPAPMAPATMAPAPTAPAPTAPAPVAKPAPGISPSPQSLFDGGKKVLDNAAGAFFGSNREKSRAALDAQRNLPNLQEGWDKAKGMRNSATSAVGGAAGTFQGLRSTVKDYAGWTKPMVIGGKDRNPLGKYYPYVQGANFALNTVPDVASGTASNVSKTLGGLASHAEGFIPEPVMQGFGSVWDGVKGGVTDAVSGATRGIAQGVANYAGEHEAQRIGAGYAAPVVDWMHNNPWLTAGGLALGGYGLYKSLFGGSSNQQAQEDGEEAQGDVMQRGYNQGLKGRNAQYALADQRNRPISQGR